MREQQSRDPNHDTATLDGPDDLVPAREFTVFRWSDGDGLSESAAMVTKFKSDEQRSNVACSVRRVRMKAPTADAYLPRRA